MTAPDPPELDGADAEALLRKRVREAGSERAWGRPRGISGATISNILAGRRKIGPRVALALGLKLVRRYISARRSGC